MREFVISKVFEGNQNSCGKARAAKWKRMTKRKNTARLPPDEDSLNHHLQRTNYITYCQRHYKLKEHPSPVDHGWQSVNGKLKPLRHTSPALPDQLKPRDSTSDTETEKESSDDESVAAETTDSDE